MLKMIDSLGRITIPKKIRKSLDPNMTYSVVLDPDGSVRLVPAGVVRTVTSPSS